MQSFFFRPGKRRHFCFYCYFTLVKAFTSTAMGTTTPIQIHHLRSCNYFCFATSTPSTPTTNSNDYFPNITLFINYYHYHYTSSRNWILERESKTFALIDAPLNLSSFWKFQWFPAFVERNRTFVAWMIEDSNDFLSRLADGERLPIMFESIEKYL